MCHTQSTTWTLSLVESGSPPADCAADLFCSSGSTVNPLCWHPVQLLMFFTSTDPAARNSRCMQLLQKLFGPAETLGKMM